LILDGGNTPRSYQNHHPSSIVHHHQFSIHDAMCRPSNNNKRSRRIGSINDGDELYDVNSLQTQNLETPAEAERRRNVEELFRQLERERPRRPHESAAEARSAALKAREEAYEVVRRARQLELAKMYADRALAHARAAAIQARRIANETAEIGAGIESASRYAARLADVRERFAAALARSIASERASRSDDSGEIEPVRKRARLSERDPLPDDTEPRDIMLSLD
jgi:hypothetical protein